MELLCNKLILRGSNGLKQDNPQRNYHTLASKIDIDCTHVRQAMGALIHFMQSTVFHLDNGYINLSSIRTLSLPNYLRMDMETMTALQIFCEERHPNVIKGAGKGKEGNFPTYCLIMPPLSLQVQSCSPFIYIFFL